MSGTAPKTRETDLAVLGAGPGGYAAAFRAADLGLKVTLIDPEENPGGVCLYRGCIPSKAFLHMAALVEQTRRASEHGLVFGEPKIDREALLAWKNGVVGKLTGGLGTLCKNRKIDYVRGRGVLHDAHTLELQTDQADWARLQFKSCIVATGSRPSIPAGINAESPRVMTSTGALDLEDIPARLLVIGGGYIGLELATVYAALGSQVTVVEMMPELLTGPDRDLVRVLTKAIEPRLAAVLLETKVAGMKDSGSAMRVRLEGKDGTSKEDSFDRVLVAVGRKPNSTGLGLSNTKAVVNKRGFVEVDEARRTAEPSIYAIGDVAGDPMLAHKATHEGIVAAECAAGHRRAFEPAAIPAVVFTDPEIAWCGVTEAQAREQKLEVSIGRFPWGASGRALTLGAGEGLTKVIVDKASGRILGVGIVGSGAGDLIASAVHAIEMGSTAEDLAMTIHPHPTLSETVMEAAEAALGSAIHIFKPKRA